MQEHPGGAEIILQYAGKDATEEYEVSIHRGQGRLVVLASRSTYRALGGQTPSGLRPAHCQLFKSYGTAGSMPQALETIVVSANAQPIHPPDAIKENLDPSKHLGKLTGELPEEKTEEKKVATPESAPPASAQSQGVLPEPEPFVKPPLDQILSLHDFEAVARATMNRRAWNYYSSGADDEITMVSAVLAHLF